MDTADETFTPVRLSVDCERDVWDTAERLGRESRTLACSMSSFARFKIRVRRLRAWRLGRRRLAGDHIDTVRQTSRGSLDNRDNQVVRVSRTVVVCS